MSAIIIETQKHELDTYTTAVSGSCIVYDNASGYQITTQNLEYPNSITVTVPNVPFMGGWTTVATPTQGWECPACQIIHAPFVRSCECKVKNNV
jgi:hypothetical protein